VFEGEVQRRAFPRHRRPRAPRRWDVRAHSRSPPSTRRSSTARSSQLSSFVHRAEQAAAALSKTISVGGNSMRQAPVCMKLCTPQPVSVVRSWRQSAIG
jgi:hypothetical protein